MLKKIILTLSFIILSSPSLLYAVEDAPIPLDANSPAVSNNQSAGGYTYQTLVNIPGLGSEVTIAPGSLAVYLQTIFNYIIGAAIALAVVMIIYGGVTYATTDAAGKKEEGKTIVTDALYGLALALGSYLILNTINPELLNFDLDVGKLERVEVSKGTVVVVDRSTSISNGTMGLGDGSSQNGKTFTPASNNLIVKCPHALTRIGGKPICPDLLQKLQSAAKKAGVTLTVGQTFNPAGKPSPSDSGCHKPGGTSPYAGSCADVGFSGRPEHNQAGWGAFCQAIGTTPGLFTNNEASGLEECTRYVGGDNFKPGKSSGPHLHVLYTGGSI